MPHGGVPPRSFSRPELAVVTERVHVGLVLLMLGLTMLVTSALIRRGVIAGTSAKGIDEP